MAKDMVQVETIPQLSEYLGSIKQAQDSDSAIADALSAQLQVLGVVNSPSLTVSAFDLMLESLKSAVEKTENPQQKKEFQRNAAVMTNSMIFFLDAKLYWEDKKWSQQGQELLKSACQLVAETSVALIKTAGTKGVFIATDMGREMAENLINNVGGFFAKIIDAWGRKERIEQYKKEFNTFLLAVFDKLQRHREIFGTQTLLKELILRYMDVLIPIAGNKANELRKINPDNEALIPLPAFKSKTVGVQIILKLLSVVAIVVAIAYFFNWWGGDKWVEAFAESSAFLTIFSIHFSILELPFIIKILLALVAVALPYLGIFASSNIKYDEIHDYHYLEAGHKVKIAKQYYLELADSFGL